jgi:hypothetical protein
LPELLEEQMGIARILDSIDRQIAALERVRALLGGTNTARNGDRPRGSVWAESDARPARRKKRKLTPEGRKRIAEAVKRRWERQRQAAAAAQN